MQFTSSIADCNLFTLLVPYFEHNLRGEVNEIDLSLLGIYELTRKRALRKYAGQKKAVHVL